MSRQRAKNARVLVLAGFLMSITTGIVVYAPTLYQMFCNITGFGGTVQRAVAPEAVAATSDTTVTVSFDANVAQDLPWTFRPAQRKVEARIGEPTKVYYTAHNNSDETVVGRATFNVTPFKSAPYFFKIECFCFTEEKLGPGESARMPLVFYVDQQMLKDKTTAEVRDITLSYTFFRRDDELTAEEVEAARDLKAGSEAIDEELERTGAARFDNDAPRR